MNHTPTILQIVPEMVSGGVERGTVEIARAIQAQGWGNLAVSAGGPMLSQLAHAGARHITLPVSRKHPWVMYGNIAKLEAIIREHHVSLVHARSRVPAWAGYFAAKRTGVPFITTFHGVYGTKGLFKKQYNSVMTRGAKVIAVSRYIRDHILREYPACPAQRIEVIHRGADLNSFHPELVTPGILAELSDRWRISDRHAPIILMPGRLTRWKGHHVLLEALSRLSSLEFLVLIVGDANNHPAYRAELEQLVARYRLEGKVQFVGHTPHMTEAYALSDLVVCPSIEPEAFGRVPVEAQAMGKPIIATNHGGACETVVDGVTGFLVEPNHAPSLAERIGFLLKSGAAQRESMGQAGLLHVHEHFSIETMQRKTIAVYESLLS